MAAYEVLLLNTAIPQIQAAQSGDTYVVPRDIAFSAALTLSAGTANGVPYLNGSKVVTTGSALTFDGSTFLTSVGSNLTTRIKPLVLDYFTNDGVGITFSRTTDGAEIMALGVADANKLGLFSREGLIFAVGGGSLYSATSEAMRLDSSGNLGLGVTPSVVASNRNLEIGGTVNAAIVLSTNSANAAARNLAIASNFSSFGDLVFLQSNAVGGNPLTAGTQRMTLDASGNLSVGATSTSSRFEAVAGTGAQLISTFRTGDATAANNAGGGFYGISSATAATREATLWLDADGANFAGGDYFYIQKFGNSGVVNIVQYSNAAMTFYTSAQEKARITSGGYFKASNNGTYAGSTGSYHELRSSANELTVAITNTNAILSSELIYLDTAIAAGTGFFFMRAYANSVQQFQIRGDGNVYNTNGTYGTLSDQKLKQDIVDAGSQWADIKAIRFRKYRMKSDVAANPDAPAMLGVIAQELEQVSPGLVDEYPDMETVEVTDEDGNVTQTQQPTGTTTKTVKSSILLMKAAVALQEAMARIETLEAEVAALKGA